MNQSGRTLACVAGRARPDSEQDISTCDAVVEWKEHLGGKFGLNLSRIRYDDGSVKIRISYQGLTRRQIIGEIDHAVFRRVATKLLGMDEPQ